MRGKLLLCLCLFTALPLATTQKANAFDWLGRIAIDADGLSSEDPQLRLRAVRGLQKYAIEWTEKLLLQALGDPNIDVRSEAGRALAKHRVAAAIPILVEWLADSDPQSKEVAADILGDMEAPEAIPALVRSLGDPDFKIRLRATNALGKIGGGAVIVPLVTRLEDTKSDVRLAAVTQLKLLGDRRSAIPLVGLFKDPSVKVRVAAHEAVGKLEELASVPALLRSLGSRDDRVKLATITSLGNLQALSALPRLLSEHAQSNSTLHGKISYSIAQIASAHPSDANSRRALILLVEQLSQRNLRLAATEALGIAGSAAVPFLLDQLAGRISGDASTSVKILLDIGDPRATEALIAELDRGRVSQRLLLRGLQAIGDPRALLPVLMLLEDTDPAIRLAAMHSLEALISEDSGAADVIRERLQDDEIEIRHMAISYLGKLHSKASAKALEALVRDSKNLHTRARALSALAQIRSSSSVEGAMHILEEGPESLRALAADLLSEIADSGSHPQLLSLIQGKLKAQSTLAIEVLGASLRDKKNPKVESLFRRIAVAPTLEPSLAAIESLATMRADVGTLLKEIASVGEPERRRAAIAAIGTKRVPQSLPLLYDALGTSSDSLAAAAAWSLAQIADKRSKPALYRAMRGAKSALHINASAALALMATDADAKQLTSLLHHRISLVRINALSGLSTLSGAPTKKIIKIATHDKSWLVRIAAVRTLSRLDRSPETIKLVAHNDRSAKVKKVALALQKTPFRPTPRTDWRVFRVVDPDQNDAPAARKGRFFVGSDGLATASYSDQRGRITYEHFPSGDLVEGPLENLDWF